MIISNLDRDFDYNHLEVYTGGNGDVYVTVWEQENEQALRKPHTVRIGMACSGSHVPSDLKNAIWNLAQLFEKYNDCDNELQAERKYLQELNNA